MVDREHPVSHRSKSRKERPSTYIIEDRSNRDELIRLRIQDRLTTAQMGGVLPEQTDPSAFYNILDVACGTGGWLIETAKTYAHVSSLVGVDISNNMIDAATHGAEVQEVDDRVQFLLMDVLDSLTFPDDTFDLVNQRFAMSFLRTWDWPKLLQEFRRVLVPGGVLRLTEVDTESEGSSSPTLLRMNRWLGEALFKSGHYFERGITSELKPLLTMAGYAEVQVLARKMEFQAGTEMGDLFIENMEKLYKTAQPFLRKWVKLPDQFEPLYQQLVEELRQPGFFLCGYLTTVWGRVPPKLYV